VTKINDHVTTPMILPCIQDGCRESCTTDSHRWETGDLSTQNFGVVRDSCIRFI